jgi:iron complex outermembrane receptor protein
MNDANTEIYKSYLISNARISYKITYQKLPFKIRLIAGINNLLNINYASMILVNAPSFGTTSPRYYYPGLPRNFSFGLRMEL